jgi:hypothetical protein
MMLSTLMETQQEDKRNSRQMDDNDNCDEGNSKNRILLDKQAAQFPLAGKKRR